MRRREFTTFVGGVGLSSHFKYQRALMANEVVDAGGGEQAPKTKVFISYSRKNMAFAGRLEAVLKEREFEPLIDRTEIHAFEDWWKCHLSCPRDWLDDL